MFEKAGKESYYSFAPVHSPRQGLRCDIVCQEAGQGPSTLYRLLAV